MHEWKLYHYELEDKRRWRNDKPIMEEKSLNLEILYNSTELCKTSIAADGKNIEQFLGDLSCIRPV